MNRAREGGSSHDVHPQPPQRTASTTTHLRGWEVCCPAPGNCLDTSPGRDCGETTLGSHWVPGAVAVQVPKELGWSSQGQDEKELDVTNQMQGPKQSRVFIATKSNVTNQSTSGPKPEPNTYLVKLKPKAELDVSSQILTPKQKALGTVTVKSKIAVRSNSKLDTT